MDFCGHREMCLNRNKWRKKHHTVYPGPSHGVLMRVDATFDASPNANMNILLRQMFFFSTQKHTQKEVLYINLAHINYRGGKAQSNFSSHDEIIPN